MAAALLLHATAQGDAEQVAALLEEHLADVNARNEIGDTALHYAAGRGLIDLMELLLSYGADPNAQESDAYGAAAPIHLTVRANNLQATDLLLVHRANPNVQDSMGFTPLHIAARSGYFEIAQLLISKGACLDSKDNFGKTPYTHAKDNLHDDIAKLLPPVQYDWFAESSARVQVVEVVTVVKKEKKSKKGKKKGKKGGKKKKKK